MGFEKRLNFVLILFLVLGVLCFPKFGRAIESPILWDIAVMDFANATDNPDLHLYGESIGQMISKELVPYKLSLADHGRVKSVLEDMVILDIGKADLTTMAEIGRTVGVQYLLTGTLSQLADKKSLQINAQLIEVQSGRIVGSWTERATPNALSGVATKIANAVLKQLTLILRDIAIAPLANISVNPELDKYGEQITEALFTELAYSQKLSLVERSRLKDVIQEITRGQLGLIDPATAVQIGKAVGARHIFVGTLSEFKGGVVIVGTRLIEIESGKIRGGWNERTTVSRLSLVPFKLAKKILDQLFPPHPIVPTLKSAILPSWGQFSTGRQTTGTVSLIGSLAAIGVVVATHQSLSGAEDELETLQKSSGGENTLISVEAFDRLTDEIRQAEKAVDDKRKRRNLAFGVLGAVYGLNLLDAYIGTALLRKSRQQAVQRTLAFEPTPDLRGIVMRMRF